MREIPKIMHQIWCGSPLPENFKMWGETWKKHHPKWEYILWDENKMNAFVLKFYPELWKVYNSFHYDVQRWDSIRYLILYTMGGLYVDFDSECLKPLDKLLENKECCFSLEPEEQQRMFDRELYFNNALIASLPEHPFMKKIIDKTFDYRPDDADAKDIFVTTGPLMLVDLYLKEKNKENIYLIPPKYTSPLTRHEGIDLMNGRMTKEIEDKLKDAYSIHYFFNGWVNQTF